MSTKIYSRTAPYFSHVQERYLLTSPSSTKKTYHLSLAIPNTPLPHKVGDSIGVLPTNDPQEVEQILKLIGASGEESIYDTRSHTHLPSRDFLLNKANLARVNRPFLKFVAEKKEEFIPLLQDENKGELNAFLHSHTLLEILTTLPKTLLAASEFCNLLMPLMPRFYSIANSAKMFPDEIHLTISYVHYLANGQVRRGVGSHFLCDLARIDETPIPIYLQPSHGFTLPEDPAASIILVGPGTGIAPFRAFLQERLALQTSGRNWLFFGERNRAFDFYYEDFWLALEKQNRLRLDLAFSRDQPKKVYVQHKMYEQKKSLWSWLQEGAYFYVSGDAEEMAKDVDAMLHQIAREEGNLPEEGARLYVKTLRAEKRYLIDVY